MRLPSLLISSILFGCLAGCGGSEHQDIKQWMEESSRDMKGGIPPLPELKPFPIVSYDAYDMAEPFSSVRLDPEKTATAGANQPDMDRPR
jgi:type IV pilus assembly protein PilP